jgi:hypothetical protein
MKLLKIICLLLLLSACGGGSDALDNNRAEGGIGGTGISIGPISGFGSVFVNDVQYDTRDATILINAQVAQEEDLQLGMVVTVAGSIEGDQGIAHQVKFSENVKGPLQSIDEYTQSIVVLGQTILANDITILDGVSTFSDLQTNDIVEVSGLADANGIILATRIAVVTTPPVYFNVKGRISTLDADNRVFMLNELLVDYSTLSVLEYLPGIGDFVTVQGHFVEGRLLAEQLKRDYRLSQAHPDTRIILKGLITKLTSTAQFKVAHQTVLTTINTYFKWGNNEDLMLDIEVVVHGQLDAQQALIAEKIEFLGAATGRTPPGFIHINAPITAINTSDNQIHLLDLWVSANNKTLFNDKREHLRYFRLAELRIGDRVDVTGFLTLETQQIIAELIVRAPAIPLAQEVLEGPVQRFDAVTGRLDILGIAIITHPETRYQKALSPPPFKDKAPRPTQHAHKRAAEITATQFFLELVEKTRVNVQGHWEGAVIQANVVTLLSPP